MKHIQWFPGHMTKAMRMMEDSVKLCDGVLVILDARAPAATYNKNLKKLFGNKPVLYVLNKSDLADEGQLDLFDLGVCCPKCSRARWKAAHAGCERSACHGHQ